MNNVLDYFSLFHIFFSATILMMFYDYTIRSVMKAVSNVSCFQKYCWISLNNEVLKNVYINQKKKKCLVNCQLGYIRKCDKLWKTVPFKTRWSRKVFRISPLLMKLVSHGSVNCSDLSCAGSSFVLNDIREEAVTHYMQEYGVLCHSHSEWEDSWMEGALPQSVHLYNVKTQFNLQKWRKKKKRGFIYLPNNLFVLFCLYFTRGMISSFQLTCAVLRHCCFSDVGVCSLLFIFSPHSPYKNKRTKIPVQWRQGCSLRFWLTYVKVMVIKEFLS